MAAIVDRPGPSRTLSLSLVIGRVRLISGLILFAYVLTHLLNHAVGIWSLEALAATREPFVALWRNPVGTVLLYGGLAAHVLIALRAVWLRDSLRTMTAAEIASASAQNSSA